MLWKSKEHTEEVLTHQDEPDDDYQKKITFQRKTAVFQGKWLKKYERILMDIQTNSKKKVKPNPDSEQLPEIWFYQNLFLRNLQKGRSLFTPQEV